MSKVRLRVNSKGWWWVWLTFYTSEWPPIREVLVGPSETAEAAYARAMERPTWGTGL